MNWFKFKLLQCGDVTYPPSSFCFDAFLGQEFFCFSKNNFVRSLCYFVINKSHIRSAWLKWRHYFDLMYQEFKKLFYLCLEKCIALQQYLNQQNKRVLCKTNCKELGLEQKILPASLLKYVFVLLSPSSKQSNFVALVYESESFVLFLIMTSVQWFHCLQDLSICSYGYELDWKLVSMLFNDDHFDFLVCSFRLLIVFLFQRPKKKPLAEYFQDDQVNCLIS